MSQPTTALIYRKLIYHLGCQKRRRGRKARRRGVADTHSRRTSVGVSGRPGPGPGRGGGDGGGEDCNEAYSVTEADWATLLSDNGISSKGMEDVGSA